VFRILAVVLLQVGIQPLEAGLIPPLPPEKAPPVEDDIGPGIRAACLADLPSRALAAPEALRNVRRVNPFPLFCVM